MESCESQIKLMTGGWRAALLRCNVHEIVSGVQGTKVPKVEYLEVQESLLMTEICTKNRQCDLLSRI